MTGTYTKNVYNGEIKKADMCESTVRFLNIGWNQAISGQHGHDGGGGSLTRTGSWVDYIEVVSSKRQGARFMVCVECRRDLN